MVGEIWRLAEEDLETILQEEFGVSMTLRQPKGEKFKTFIGDTNLMSTMLDPDTGLMVTGQSCFCILRTKEVLDHFGELPKSLWTVTFEEFSKGTYRVKDVNPDSTQGILHLTLGN